MIQYKKGSVYDYVFTVIYIIIVIYILFPVQICAQTSVSISPDNIIADTDETFSVDVTLNNVSDLHGSKIIVTFDPSVIQVQNLSRGPFLRSTGYSSFFNQNIDNANGKVQTDEAVLGQGTVSGSGVLATITFTCITDGASTIAVTEADLRDLENQAIPADKYSASVQVGNGGIINQAPDVDGLPDQSIVLGGSFNQISLDDYVIDPDNIDADLQWTYSGAINVNVSISDRVATLSPQSGWTGSETITFRAADPGGLYDEDSAIFRVSAAANLPPAVVDIPGQTIQQGGNFIPITLDDFVDDPDNIDEDLIWTCSGSTNLTVTMSDRIATVTYPAGWTGSETITFRATDPGGLYDEASVVLTVSTQDNQAPVLVDIPDQSVRIGRNFSQISLDFYVTDPDHSDMELSWTYSGSSFLTVSIIDHVATISPQAGWTGSETVIFRVTDPDGLYDEDSAGFSVTNEPPVVNEIPNQTISLNGVFSEISLDLYVTDPDHSDNELSWSYSGGTALSVSIFDHVAVITPQTGWTGTETITFRAVDPGGLYDEDSVDFTVSNQPPVVSDIPDQSVPLGGSFSLISLDMYVTDPDHSDNEISWTYSGNTDMTVSVMGGVATVIPPDRWSGSETITFRATDPGGLYDEESTVFSVINEPPDVDGIPDQTIDPGDVFTHINLDDYVSDPDNSDNDMTWTYSGNTNMTVSISDRVAAVTPQARWTGTETITFRATDPGGLYDEYSVMFSVNATSRFKGTDTIDSYPNPFNPLEGTMTVRYRFSADCTCNIYIYDNSNTLVSMPGRSEQCIKDVLYTCEWNGMNDDGLLVSNGVYYFVIKTDAGVREIWKVAVVY